MPKQQAVEPGWAYQDCQSQLSALLARIDFQSPTASTSATVPGVSGWCGSQRGCAVSGAADFDESGVAGGGTDDDLQDSEAGATEGSRLPHGKFTYNSGPALPGAA